MEASFKIDGCNTLTVGNNVSVPDCCQSDPFIGIVHRYEPLGSGPRSARMQHVAYACGASARAGADASPLPETCPTHAGTSVDCRQVYRQVDSEDMPTIVQTQVARLKPHEARALASVLLSAATEAQGK